MTQSEHPLIAPYKLRLSKHLLQCPVPDSWSYIRRNSRCRHQMETFSALLAICKGNSPVTGQFPAQRSVTWSFDVFFDLRLNKRLTKQWRGWWFETPSCPLWRHCYVLCYCFLAAMTFYSLLAIAAIQLSIEQLMARNGIAIVGHALCANYKYRDREYIISADQPPAKTVQLWTMGNCMLIVKF